eukprot:6173149-Pleurochrysis_carterae.AAC.1
MVTVVNFLAGAPSAHWAKVTVSAWVCCSACRTAGNAHRGAWEANCGHHAIPLGSPQSAGFSTAHTAPAPSAAIIRSAVNRASVLCFVR